MSPDITPIFLLSLPRSGSTLLQRILANHPAVTTVPEPWLLLPPLYALRREGIRAEYDHGELVTAMEDLVARLPEGVQTYRDAVRGMALAVYGSLAPGGQRYFLDKTPRYHLIASELAEMFPEAKFILLWRQPLAVAASMLRTWHGGKWLIRRYEVDLVDGVKHLTGFAGSGMAHHALRYEDLLEAPEDQVRALCGFLELPFEDGLLHGLDQVLPAGGQGDPTGTDHSTVAAGTPDAWAEQFRGTVRKTWARDYLQRLGAERLRKMGYDLPSLLDQVGRIPGWSPTIPTDILRSTMKGSR